jgi:hypothetical protein
MSERLCISCIVSTREYHSNPTKSRTHTAFIKVPEIKKGYGLLTISFFLQAFELIGLSRAVV